MKEFKIIAPLRKINSIFEALYVIALSILFVFHSNLDGLM